MKFNSKTAPANKHKFPTQSDNDVPLAFAEILFLQV